MTYQCSQKGCGEIFRSLSACHLHSKVHIGSKPFKCPYEGCTKEYSTKKSLNTHIIKHTGESPYVCSWKSCGAILSSAASLKVHTALHTNDRTYRCDLCEKSYIQKTSFEVHYRTHTGDKPFVCPREGCSARYTTNQSLKVHIQNHDIIKIPKEGPLVTPIIIRRSVEGSSEETLPQTYQVYQCRKCLEEFTNSFSLAHHHRGCYFWCSLEDCYQPFWSKEDLLTHQEASHKKPSSTLHRCECGNLYLTEDFLKRHQEKAHGVPL